ncbi:unnamed protein product [Darwinula stevensoni]|uniref:Myosin motor domain-containing protein n=1 Tax=Darwinula stevensoni TaxID=69355 RepID=A0A7R8X9L1_9CRUS|nr:unnamed protein product [Darwinula stevensoni]CAG0891194.1 unnamed protein product [Darwinula stevensoni]
MLGDYVWMKPEKKGQFDVAIGAQVVKIAADKLSVVDDEGKWQSVALSRILKVMNSTSIEGMDDMISLGELDEASILRNLFIRYKNKLIYTYTGSILVAVNPYQCLPIYTAERIKLYQDRNLGELPPHIFAIADNCYTHMRRDGQDQCIVISGESGAGKTENTKLTLQYLAAISGRHSQIEQQVLAANPILEAFGNAKTIRNDNSSRFGKYTEIHFNPDGAIVGAQIKQYLLEKSRIVSQANEERSFHIFYSLLDGLDAGDKQRLDLVDASSYKYLTEGSTAKYDGRDDRPNFSDIRSAMKELVFSDSEISDILKVLAVILHMGNIEMEAHTIDHLDATQIPNMTHVERIGKLVDLEPAAIVKGITTKTIIIQNEPTVSNLAYRDAVDVRDALAKGIYARLFVWIVGKINSAIIQPEAGSCSLIGLLDIFGFENFDHNSFEQLCINFANETLHQFFFHHIFKLEQEEYDAEGIEWNHIDFVDNQDCLDLIGKKPMNIMSLMDEECMMPKGTDQTLLAKFNTAYSKDKSYLKPTRHKTNSFGIAHFAGEVYYDVQGFCEKNCDTFSISLIQLIELSGNKFLRNLFQADIIRISQNNKRSPSISVQFRTSLESLMKTLSLCQPFFVRCIKPNEQKKSMLFVRGLCCRQLKYLGMMETARIRQAGYPIRHAFQEFVGRYWCLSGLIPPSKNEDKHERARQICENVLGSSGDYQLGTCKVFLKIAGDLHLEQERNRILRNVAIVQRHIRRWCQRRRAAAIVIKRFLLAAVRHGRFRAWRSFFLIRFRKLRRQLILFQKLWRTYLANKSVNKEDLGEQNLQNFPEIPQSERTEEIEGTMETPVRVDEGVRLRDKPKGAAGECRKSCPPAVAEAEARKGGMAAKQKKPSKFRNLIRWKSMEGKTPNAQSAALRGWEAANNGCQPWTTSNAELPEGELAPELTKDSKRKSVFLRENGLPTMEKAPREETMITTALIRQKLRRT